MGFSIEGCFFPRVGAVNGVEWMDKLFIYARATWRGELPPNSILAIEYFRFDGGQLHHHDKTGGVQNVYQQHKSRSNPGVYRVNATSTDSDFVGNEI